MRGSFTTTTAVLIGAGLLAEQIALRYRTPDGFEREREARSRLSWVVRWYFYTRSDFTPRGWRIFQTGIALLAAGVFWYYFGPLIARR